MLKDHKIITIGEILVEFVSHVKNCALTQVGPYTGPYPSGAPAIFIDQAALVGGSTAIVGGVGEDGFGRGILKRLQADGVGIENIAFAPGVSTGTAFVSYYDNGTRDFIFHLHHTAAEVIVFDPQLFDHEKIILHVSAASLGNAVIRSATMSAVHSVLRAGGKISCDPNARPELMRDTAARLALEEVIAESFCLLPSTSDLAFLYPDQSEDAALTQLMKSNAAIIAIKRGAQGASIIQNGNRIDFPGHDVTEVDPTGAGDCFCGTFISLLTQGVTPETAGRLANAAGAMSVEHRGPMEGNSSRTEIEAFLAARNPRHVGAFL
jgi:sugar/nucleoside kinase (ribokinase family)|tara:strand:- start:108 stop:1073 length:966 start_codon:yes stop_codon:yes gene_type:complete